MFRRRKPGKRRGSASGPGSSAGAGDNCLPVADIVLGAVDFIGALGPDVVTGFVLFAGIGVLVGLVPRIERDFGVGDVGAAPFFAARRRARDERLESVRRR